MEINIVVSHEAEYNEVMAFTAGWEGVRKRYTQSFFSILLNFCSIQLKLQVGFESQQVVMRHV